MTARSRSKGPQENSLRQHEEVETDRSEKQPDGTGTEGTTSRDLCRSLRVWNSALYPILTSKWKLQRKLKINWIKCQEFFLMGAQNRDEGEFQK
jgi:hypothetical protein